MNADSILAIEYVYVLNSDLLDDECVDLDTEPPATDDPETEKPTEDPETDETETDQPTTGITPSINENIKNK